MYVVIVLYDDNSPKLVFGCYMDYDEALRWATNNLNTTRKYSIMKISGDNS